MGWVVPVLVLSGIAIVIFYYNQLMQRKVQVSNAFSTVDVYLKQRYDLIPNLVSAVKGYMTHERELLEEITKIRSQVTPGSGVLDAQTVSLNRQLSSALSRLSVTVENYPQLKANQNFLQLQQALVEVEENIAAARRNYNAAVADLNRAVEMFPTNLLAVVIGLPKALWFETPEGEKPSPVVKNLLDSSR